MKKGEFLLVFIILSIFLVSGCTNYQVNLERESENPTENDTSSYNPEILEQFEKNDWVPILVELKNKNVEEVLSNLSDSQFKLRESLLWNKGFGGEITKEGFDVLIKHKDVNQIFPIKITPPTLIEDFEKNDWVPILVELKNKNVEEVLSNLSDSQFRLEEITLFENGFSGEITKKGFDILVGHSDVFRIYSNKPISLY